MSRVEDWIARASTQAAELVDPRILAAAVGLVSERGIAHFLLSLLFGRVMVDLTGDPADDEAWLAASMAAMQGVVSLSDESVGKKKRK